MSDPGAAPEIPVALQIYDSYAVDPLWQKYFTYTWLAFTLLSILYAFPSLLRSFRSPKRVWSSLLGFQESLTPPSPSPRSPTGGGFPTASTPTAPSAIKRLQTRLFSIAQTILLPSMPILSIVPSKLSNLLSKPKDCCRKSYLSLTVGQIILVAGYGGVVLYCLLKNSELNHNSNRAGFLALAQLTPLLLLSLKNNPIGLLLGLGHEKLNPYHRWAGRILWLTATVHGGIWISLFVQEGQADQIKADKSLRGIASWVLLTMLAVSSVRLVRGRFYAVFWTLHVLSFSGFFAAVAYHTPYARPWIFPPIALYVADLFMRMLKYRVKDAILVALDGDMTMIHIPDITSSFRPTQHVYLRVLAGPFGAFSSHPLTITNSPGFTNGVTLYAKGVGSWTRSLGALARAGELSSEDEDEDEKEDLLEKERVPGRAEVKVVLDGPYGGCGLDLGAFGDVLLVAGGSGVTFLLGCVEELLSACEAEGGGGRSRKCDAVWVVKDLATIKALTPILSHLHTRAHSLPSPLILTYHLHLTSPPSPLPTVPLSLPNGTTLSPYRPSISQLIREALPLSSLSPSSLAAEPNDPEMSHATGEGRGLAVVACGPEGIVSEARNAVGGLGVGERVRVGGVEFWGECYGV